MPRDLVDLNAWMRDNLRVQWVAIEMPWNFETQVIGLLRPPLNQDHNTNHPMFSTVEEARRLLQESGKSNLLSY